VYSPVTGEVTEINEELLDSPQNINQAPYEAWLLRVKNVTETVELMDAKAYAAMAKEE